MHVGYSTLAEIVRGEKMSVVRMRRRRRMTENAHLASTWSVKTVQTENRGAKELPEAVDEFIQILMTRLVFSLGQRSVENGI